MVDGDPGRDRLALLMNEIAAEVPGFRVVAKATARSQRVIHWLLTAVTFGQSRSYLEGFTTTIGRTVWVTSDWEQMSRDSRYLTLLHERIHLRQFRRFTLVGMVFLYLFVPLPLGLAYFRARFEREAYGETIRGTAALLGADRVRDPAFRADIVEQFTGPSYGWMWPFRASVERWYDRVLAELGPQGVV